MVEHYTVNRSKETIKSLFGEQIIYLYVVNSLEHGYTDVGLTEEEALENLMSDEIFDETYEFCKISEDE